MTTSPPHHPPRTPFGRDTTAAQVLAGTDLSERTALVTGGYSGLGLESTRALSRAGARVLVPARRPDAGRRATAGMQRVDVGQLDLADMSSIRRYAHQLLDTGTTIDILICGAGVMAIPESRVGPGWEGHFAVNHLGHHALVNLLRPALQPGSRVVVLSSAGHFLSGIRWHDPQLTTGYDRWIAYAQSKTANALFALHLDALARNADIHAFSVHPGSILTPLQRHIPEVEQRSLGWIDAHGRPATGFKTPAQGAATAVWAATSAQLAGHGGAYCQDCDLASPATTDDMLVGGYKPWAADPAGATRLWALSADLTGLDAFS
ncbi:oxidoreductase [Parafrankia sp. BMG5.11]|uniref:oxidoreductase n=1 Tax=Parafrankia sp. BMG5.11 TaxID=222540 RepID=UPI00103F2C99|nr:oxidoreductase [Parafrankia sp. BMG5.11]TCJ35586.1 SDR family NAD(P)-dependent oxidoreductase [Parafrankia sp. BMG5.11]